MERHDRKRLKTLNFGGFGEGLIHDQEREMGVRGGKWYLETTKRGRIGGANGAGAVKTCRVRDGHVVGHQEVGVGGNQAT